MINFLLQGLYSFLNFIINLFPSGSGFPSEVHEAFNTLGGYTGMIDVFIPLTIILWCLLFIFGIEILVFGFSAIKWIISHIPFIGGKGNQ